MSTTGFERRISETCPHLSRGQVKKIAKRLAYRAEKMQTVHDFEHALKVLGIYTDSTARDALMTRSAA